MTLTGPILANEGQGTAIMALERIGVIGNKRGREEGGQDEEMNKTPNFRLQLIVIPIILISL